MRIVLVKLRRMRVLQADRISGKLDHCALHAETDAEEGNASLAGKPDRLHLAFNAPLAEPAGNQKPIDAGEKPLRPLAFDELAVKPLDAELGPIGDAAVIEGLVDRLVGVFVLRILADHSDRDLMLGITEPVEQVVQTVEVGRSSLQAERHDQFIKAVLHEA